MILCKLFRTGPAFCLFLLFIAAGCAGSPSEETIREVITVHIESEYFKVSDIVIGHVQKIPGRDKQYGGAAGFLVNVPSISLEFTKNTGAPSNYKKGHHLTFNDVRVRIEKSTDRQDEWVITNISGIPLL